MYLSVICLPLIGSIVSGFFGSAIGASGSMLVAISCMLGAFFCSVAIFFEVALSGSTCFVNLFNWFSGDSLEINVTLFFDSITSVMLLVVNTVSLLVHIYSISYMELDPHRVRFFSYLSLFTFFMLCLVTASNLIQVFIGWEGVGLCSYLLISFWFTRIQAAKSAIKAVVVNKIGDFGLVLAIMLCFLLFGSTNFSTIFPMVQYYSQSTISLFNTEIEILYIISMFLVLAAVGKSAQVGLHTWLPDAMEGPTPVSALIHAATMVTAGVFLLIRCSPILEYSPLTLSVITVIGCLTSLFAASAGLVQNDLKRVIAYSTCSQLGYMVFACGLSSYSLSLFHLFNHAFFKALLFLSAGAVIHALADEQDMRKMGGLLKLLPFSYTMFVVASLSLMAVPYLTGFYSKDIILEVSFSKYTISGTFSHWLGTVSALFTSAYSFRLLYLTFLTQNNAFKQIISSSHDAPTIMAIPLIILLIGSIFAGYVFNDFFIGFGSTVWYNSIFTLPENYALLNYEFIPQYIKNIPFILSIVGSSGALLLAILMKDVQFGKIVFVSRIYGFLSKKWFFDNIYNKYIVTAFFHLTYRVFYKSIDRGIIETFGSRGTNLLLNKYSEILRKLQSGYIYHYTLLFVSSMIVLAILTYLAEFPFRLFVNLSNKCILLAFFYIPVFNLFI